VTNDDVRTYPRTVKLTSGSVELRKGTPADTAAMVAFARSLPEHDLLFLARDITKEENVVEWLSNPNITTLIAMDGQTVVGYTAIHDSPMAWSAHVAELRVMISPTMRGKGLGRALTQEAFAYALSLGKEKMVGQMTLDQKAAIAAFQGLGFRPEALLRDHVKDRDGQKHDLLVLSHDVERFASQQLAMGVAEVFG
jgi:RimJ/RimL family protein N-acetyltransferase